MSEVMHRVQKSDKRIRIGVIVFAAALIFVDLYCRLRLLSVPLERDEGGFAYIGQQILRGIPPFESGNMKVLGGIHFAYALIMALFGESAFGIHIGLLFVNIASIAFLFFLAKRLISFEAAFVTIGAYAYLSTSQTVIGVFAHATHFVMLFVLAGLIFLLKGLDEDRRLLIFASGLSFGTSILMKQHGVFFCIFAICLIICKQLKQKHNILKTIKKVALFISGMAVPYLTLSIYMFTHGVLAEFWFWTFTYSIDYAGLYSVSHGMEYLKRAIRRFYNYQKYVWLLAGFGLIVTCYPRVLLRERWLILSFFLVSCFAVIPGNAYHPHYFVLVIPAIAIFIGVAFEALILMSKLGTSAEIARIAAFGIVCSAFIVPVYKERDYLFSLSPQVVSRKVYGNDLFLVSYEIASYIREHSKPNAKITIIGSEPQIYFYAQRAAATDYLYMYPLDRPHPYLSKMQDEMISEVETAHPEYIIFVRLYDSWLDGAAGSRVIDWLNNYLIYYEKVGLIDVGVTSKSTCYWGPEAANRLPDSEQRISVFKRKY